MTLKDRIVDAVINLEQEKSYKFTKSSLERVIIEARMYKFDKALNLILYTIVVGLITFDVIDFDKYVAGFIGSKAVKAFINK